MKEEFHRNVMCIIIGVPSPMHDSLGDLNCVTILYLAGILLCHIKIRLLYNKSESCPEMRLKNEPYSPAAIVWSHKDVDTSEKTMAIIAGIPVALT